MGTKYADKSGTASGYNASPPADDGTQVAANQVKWSTIKTKLADTLKNYTDAINTALVNFCDFSGTAIVGPYTTTAADHMQTLECTGTFTVKLMDASTAGKGYIISIKNVGSGIITVTPFTGADTLDGTAAGSINIGVNQYLGLKVNVAASGYITISDIHPTGAILDYAGTSAPGGWLICDGTSYVRADYASLFAVIGTAFGSADGSHFNVPDFRRRVSVGAGGSASSTLGNTVGSVGGEETHALSVAELAAHSHTTSIDGSVIMLGESGTSNSSGGGNWLKPGANFSMSNAGSGTAHNNMQPSVVVNKIIKT